MILVPRLIRLEPMLNADKPPSTCDQIRLPGQDGFSLFGLRRHLISPGQAAMTQLTA